MILKAAIKAEQILKEIREKTDEPKNSDEWMDTCFLAITKSRLATEPMNPNLMGMLEGTIAKVNATEF